MATLSLRTKEGNPLKDAHGYDRKFKEFSKEIADKYFSYEKAEAEVKFRKQGIRADRKRDCQEMKTKAITELRNPTITPERRIEVTNFLKEIQK